MFRFLKRRYEFCLSVLWFVFFIISIVVMARSVLYPHPAALGGILIYAVGLFAPIACLICVWLFRKIKRVALRIVLSAATLAAAVIVMIPFVWLLLIMNSFWQSPGVYMAPIQSSTHNLKNYLKFDEEVAEWQESKRGIFPSEIPENTDNFQYKYIYKPSMLNSNCLVSVTYKPDGNTYESEKKRIGGMYGLSYKEGTHTYYYSSNYSPKERGGQFGIPTSCVDFDDESQTIVYALFQCVDPFD